MTNEKDMLLVSNNALLRLTTHDVLRFINEMVDLFVGLTSLVIITSKESFSSTKVISTASQRNEATNVGFSSIARSSAAAIYINFNVQPTA